MEEEVLDTPMQVDDEAYQEDTLAIISGEKPPLDVKLKTWEEGEQSDKEIGLIVAKDKKHYQRGLIEIDIDGHKAVVHMDALLSCIYTVYEMQNPYKNYDPTLFRTDIYGILEEVKVEATTDTMEHTRQEIKHISLDDYTAMPPIYENCKKARISIAVENIEPIEFVDYSVKDAEIIEESK